MVTFGALVANWPIFDTEYRHDEFWRSLSQKVELEPFAPLTRYWVAATGLCVGSKRKH